MNIKVTIAILLLVGLQGCDGTSMEGTDDQPDYIDKPEETIPDKPEETIPDKPEETNPDKPITVNCDAEIKNAIDLMGNDYEFENSLNGDIHHHNYRWEDGDRNWRFYYTWGGPYEGCSDTYFTTFRNTSFVPSDNVCTSDIQGVLDNYGGQVKQFDSFLHDKAIEFTYSWFDDGFYYKFEDVFGSSNCDITFGYY